MVYSQNDPYQGITEEQNNIQCSNLNTENRYVIKCIKDVFVFWN